MKRLVGNTIPTNVFGKDNPLDEAVVFKKARDLAFKVHPRAADTYFIATETPVAGAAGFKIPHEIIRHLAGKKGQILTREDSKRYLKNRDDLKIWGG